MKKNLWTLLLALMLCVSVVPAAAFAQEEEAPAVLEGFVVDILDGGFIIEDAAMGEVMLNTSDATVWDGILIEEELQVGQYVIVQYDGRMTFSLPPQAHADHVGCYVLEGVVTEIFEDSFLLDGDPIFGNVLIRNGREFEHIYAGMPITVYYDGVMTLSLPGKANARHIVMPQLEGVVSGSADEGFTLTDADGVEYQVFFGVDTVVSELWPETEEEAAEEAVVEEETAEEEAVAEETVEETAEEAVEEETAEETAEEPAEESAEILLTDGDYVTVYFNGATTRSLPAQLTAMEVLIHR